MIKSCEKCRQARTHLSVIFIALIITNFVFRALLGIETTSLSDVLIFPSFGLLISAVLIYFFKKNKD